MGRTVMRLKKIQWELNQLILESSLAASPSPPGWSSGRMAKLGAEGGEGLANIALD